MAQGRRILFRTVVPYGKNKLPLRFERGTSVHVLDISRSARIRDKGEAIREALRNPIGTLRLSEVAKGKNTAAIAISDFSRSTLDRQMLPLVMAELNAGGIRPSDIVIIIGGGLHMKMKPQEVRAKVGGIASKVRVIQHDARRNLDFVGKSRFGNEIWINRAMVRADVKVALGDIVPHPYAGFSAGGKGVMPGLGGRETIIRNHLMVKPDLNVGQMENNPVREEIDEAARMLHLDFIVNTVQDADGKLVKVVAGDPIEAHREGVRSCKKIYAINVESRPDVLVASAFPYDHDFYYASKPLENIRGIVKEGSTVVLVSPCKGGIGSKDLAYFLRLPTSKSILDSIKQNPEKNLVTALVAYQVACIREQTHIVAYSEGLKPRVLQKIGFKKSNNLQETVNSAMAYHGASCETVVLPHASTCMPVLVSK